MNARAEAFERLGGRYEVRVLEPSPPAVAEGPWFADDPVAAEGLPDGRELVSPVSTGDRAWGELARDDAELASWCSERWLGAYRRLAPAPPKFVETRESLHRLAEQVISKARERANGKIGLRYTRGGFGTPFFGADVQIRVSCSDAVHVTVQTGSRERSTPVKTIGDAARMLGPDLVSAEDGGELPLVADNASGCLLGDWFGFSYSVLEQLRAEARATLEPSRVQIWPEHFDASLELGAESAGQRAAYGCSPGDEHHPEPYVYVAPWSARPEGELWQATGFSGAELPYRELLAAVDQRGAALDFLRARLEALTS